jgi:hypothetical protein
MALVKVNSAIYETPVNPPLKNAATYTLDISAEEMAALWCTLQLVGGSPDDTVRKYCQNITEVLNTMPEFKSAMWGPMMDDIYNPTGVRQLTDNSSRGSIIYVTGSDKNRRFLELVNKLKRAQR